MHHKKRAIVKPPVYWVGVSNMQRKWAEQMWIRGSLAVALAGAGTPHAFESMMLPVLT